MEPNNSLGIAKGRIEIDLQRLQQQRQIVVQSAQQMGDGVKKAFQSSASAVNNFNQSLNSTISNLQKIQGELLAISLASGVFNKAGLQAAENFRLLETRFIGLTGSQEKAAQYMNEIADGARAVGVPVREAQTLIAGLSNQLQLAGVSAAEALDIMSRLQLVDPTASFYDVQVAFRELLSGNPASLVRRFEVGSVDEVKRLIEVNGLYEGLDILLNNAAASSDLAAVRARGLSGSLTRIKDASTEALEKAFLPHLEAVASGIDGVTAILSRIPDGILSIVGGFSLLTTGIASGTLALARFAETYKSLKDAGAFNQIGRGVSVGLGAQLGLEVSRSIGFATGNKELQEADFGTVVEILKKGVFLIVNAVIEEGRKIAKTFAYIAINLGNIPAMIDRFRGLFEVATGNLINSIGQFITDLAASLPVGGNEVRGIGEALSGLGGASVASGRQRILDADSQLQSASEEALTAIDTMFDEFQQQNGIFFGYIEAQAEETTTTIVDRAVGLLGQLKSEFDTFLQSRVGSIDFDIGLQTDINRLSREGSAEEINNRVQALEDERKAIDAFLPQLEALAPANEDAAEALAEYTNRLAEIETETNRLSQIVVPLANKALKSLNDNFVETLQEIENASSQGIQEIGQQLSEDLADLNEEVADKTKDLREDERKLIADYQKKNEKNLKEHLARLQEINLNGREAISEAAGRLDAAGVAAAIKQRNAAREAENKKFAEEKAAEDERFSEAKQKLSEEAQEIAAYYSERYNELVNSANRERAALIQQNQQKIQEAQNAYNAERGALRTHLAGQMSQMQSSLDQQKKSVAAGYSAMSNTVGGFVNNLLNLANQLSGGSTAKVLPPKLMPPASGGSDKAVPVGGGGKGSFKIASFATGGVARTSFSEGLAYVGNKERVLTANQNQSFERLIGMIENGISQNGGGGMGFPDNISFDFSGAESIEEIIETTMLQTLKKVYQFNLGGARS